MKKIKVGIIGTGFGAKVHAPMMMEHNGFDVVAISAVTRGKPEEIKKATGIERVYSNWRDMLEKEELDLVSVTSAPYLHKEMVIEAHKQGYDVLCEKPMALDSNEAKDMINAKERANRLGFINFEFRFLPARQKVKEILVSGELGEIIHINFRGIYQGYQRNLKRKNWLGEKEKGGGMLGALGSHMIDALLWWTNKDIASVYGQLPIHFPSYTDEQGNEEIRTAEDSFQFMGDFENGTTFTVDFIFSNRNTQSWRLEVHGTNGTLIMTDDSKIEIALQDNKLTEIEIPAQLQPSEEFDDYAKKYYGSFMPMLDYLYKTILHHEHNYNIATFEDGYKVQKVMDAIRKSAELNKKVSV